jgi:hypothetical protein
MIQKSKSSRQNKLRKAPFYIILFFLMMGCLGISFDEPRRVLELATQICLSCIGIG